MTERLFDLFKGLDGIVVDYDSEPYEMFSNDIEKLIAKHSKEISESIKKRLMEIKSLNDEVITSQHTIIDSWVNLMDVTGLRDDDEYDNGSYNDDFDLRRVDNA